MSESNIIQLQKLFDECIYSTLDEEKLRSIAFDSQLVENNLEWDKIYKYFPRKEDFYASLKVYGETIIQRKDGQDNFATYRLLCRCKTIDEKSLLIKHESDGLRLYLYRDPNATIHNSHFKAVFIKAFERYSMKGEALYSILSQGYEYSCTPDELKKLLGVNYINSMLKVRVLSPAENIIRGLFDQGAIPFFTNIMLDRSVLGRGSKIIKMRFNIIDNLVLLRQKRCRADHMKFIMSQLTDLFPFDYPFLEEDIKKTSDKTIEDIYHMIRYIDKDPDYLKIGVSTLIRYKLQQKYGIKIEKE